MSIVERYILRRVLTAFLLTLFWTLAAVWTTQVVGRIDLVTDSGQSAGAFLKLATLLLPSVVPTVVPFAMVIAAAQTLSAMNADSELVVLNAAGSSRLAVAKPILLIATVAGILSFFIHSVVDPSARQQVRELVANSRADLITTVIQEGSFQKVDDGVFVQIGERLADGRLGGIFVSDSREENVDLVYYAKDGAVVRRDGASILVMEDGTVHRKAPGGDVSVIRFTSYSFDLSEFAPAADDVLMLPKDRTVGYLMNPDPNDRIWQEIPHRYRAELHARFTEWTYTIVFALIAIAVAGDARSHREARLHPMVTALVSAFFVRWLGFFAVNEAEDSSRYLPLLYLVPLGSAAMSTYFIMTNRPMELPQSWTEKLSVYYGRLWSRILEWRLALTGFSRAQLKRRL
jgi:lipopolysaccharide export system permease protein